MQNLGVYFNKYGITVGTVEISVETLVMNQSCYCTFRNKFYLVHYLEEWGGGH